MQASQEARRKRRDQRKFWAAGFRGMGVGCRAAGAGARAGAGWGREGDVKVGLYGREKDQSDVDGSE